MVFLFKSCNRGQAQPAPVAERYNSPLCLHILLIFCQISASRSDKPAKRDFPYLADISKNRAKSRHFLRERSIKYMPPKITHSPMTTIETSVVIGDSDLGTSAVAESRLYNIMYHLIVLRRLKDSLHQLHGTSDMLRFNYKLLLTSACSEYILVEAPYIRLHLGQGLFSDSFVSAAGAMGLGGRPQPSRRVQASLFSSR